MPESSPMLNRFRGVRERAAVARPFGGHIGYGMSLSSSSPAQHFVAQRSIVLL